MPSPGLYVETEISSSLEEPWRLTQEPALHERWDLRFSTIHYLPRGKDEPQRFLYTTRLGLGLEIAGEGETAGAAESATERTSALRFWSGSRLSLIRTGSGYWKYSDLGLGKVRFLTWYDYETRFGWSGLVVDRLCFRPLIGWATAWSFDRLRLWAENGVAPEQVRRATSIYTVARWMVVFVWAWHGLVPKLLFQDADELRLVAAQHLPAIFVTVAGALEIVMAVVGVLTWRWRGYFLVTAAFMFVALLSVAFASPAYLAHAFNPVTLNLSVAALCAAGWLAWPETAFASRCKRRRAKSAAKVMTP